jgi:amylosucrase
MSHVMRTHFPQSLPNATYATYLRCHDDIGWAVTDDDAGAVGISGFGHRTFLSDFYDGTFPGSFARGALFQVNETTGDKRISGSCASLAGLELALETGDRHEIDTAIDRIHMGHALIAAWGGIPLIYMGDEIAALNDYAYTQAPEHAHDSRWIHRPEMDWSRVAGLDANRDAPHARVFEGIRHILARRAAVAGFHGAVPTEVLDTGRDGVFAIARRAPTGPVVCVFNFTEGWTGLPASWFANQGVTRLYDLLSDAPIHSPDGGVALPPYARTWVA